MRFRKLYAIVACLACGVSIAAAGEPTMSSVVDRTVSRSMMTFANRSGPATNPSLLLLQMKDVREELDISDVQLEQLHLAIRENRRDRRLFFQSVIDGKIFDSDAPAVSSRELLDQWNRDFTERLEKEILDVGQRARLRELRLQLAGEKAALVTDVAKAVSLSKEQEKQLRQPGSPEGADSVLTAAQQAQLAKILGKQFDFETLRRIVGRHRKAAVSLPVASSSPQQESGWVAVKP